MLKPTSTRGVIDDIPNSNVCFSECFYFMLYVPVLFGEKFVTTDYLFVLNLKQ